MVGAGWSARLERTIRPCPHVDPSQSSIRVRNSPVGFHKSHVALHPPVLLAKCIPIFPGRSSGDNAFRGRFSNKGLSKSHLLRLDRLLRDCGEQLGPDTTDPRIAYRFDSSVVGRED